MSKETGPSGIPAPDFAEAWRVRGDNFEPEINFYVPAIKRFETDEIKNSGRPVFSPVSITGSQCSLNCDHCEGRLLRHMHYARTPDELLDLGRKLQGKGCKGMLVTGGSMSNGQVPLINFCPAMKQLKDDLGLTIAVHTGLVDEELADGLAHAGVDRAMIDIMGDRETIRGVYHLDASVEDFGDSLRRMAERGLQVTPHMVIGLHFGEVRGEARALELISRHPVHSLVLVVINPLTGTPMEGVTPPSPREAGRLFAAVRRLLPATPLILGCARPGGEHKMETDKYALEAGFNGIAYPAQGIVSLAREKGLRAVVSEYCCSMM
jgi:hypothetical protein